ncbi:unnamed protein product [Kuraishia capsulata CBS 1993]|uniref:60S ribosomal subunit assembly/export protein LOC1 n=1 Tax=Kuraishia capsulata CBS 1993 TaxID=1382522 RepID=W6MT43_9ASCO|nr:uncharacterized protein KUCA_T00004364001 [Kuraishia capsulata CBS 1993]CDK28382.1 unnamed protein product [Kuraishia capsulata CBS 1993]
MAPRQSKTAKRSKTQNGTREVTSEVTSDSRARNQLANQPNLTPKSRIHKPKKGALKKELKRVELYGKKKKREYTEKELDLPKLNMAISPGVVKKSGKKGKKFVDDHDTLVMQRLVRTINDAQDSVNESKLEKAKRLEEIREVKRQELERKEQAKVSKLEDKKQELKDKASAARILRRRNAKGRSKEEIEQEKPKKKKVSFA